MFCIVVMEIANTIAIAIAIAIAIVEEAATFWKAEFKNFIKVMDIPNFKLVKKLRKPQTLQSNKMMRLYVVYWVGRYCTVSTS